MSRRPRYQRLERGRARPHRRQRCAWPSGWAARRSPSRAGDIADDVIGLCPRATTSPRSSSASPSARAGSRCCTARWCTTDAPRRQYQRPCHRRRRRRGAAGQEPSRPQAAPEPFDLHALCRHRRHRRGGARASAWCSSNSCSVGNVALVFLTGDADLGGALRPAAVALRLRSSACWPTISSSCRRSTPSPSPIPENVVALFFFLIVAVIASNLAARARNQAVTARDARAHHRGALRLQPQARRHRHARRSAVGDGLPDRLDAEGAGRAAAARGRQASRCARAIRRRTSSTRPISPPRTGAGSTTAPPAAAPTRCPAPSACSCPCGPGAAPVGVLGIDRDRPGPLLTPDGAGCSTRSPIRRRSRSSASRWPRTSTARACTAETERLRAALLTSISHDLRTPLASIIGALTSLSSYGDAL